MDINALKRRLQEEQEKSINYQSSADRLGMDLQSSIKNNDAAFQPFENDVNQKRSSYYNSFATRLPDITNQAEYKNDPMLALQRLGREREGMQTSYGNAQSGLERRKQSFDDLVGNYVKLGQSELTKQNSLVDLLRGQVSDRQGELDRDEARKAQARQEALFSGFGGGGGGGGGALTDNKPTRARVGGKDSTGQIVMGYDAQGNPIYQKNTPGRQDNIFDTANKFFSPQNAGLVFGGARQLTKDIPFANQLLQRGQDVDKNFLSPLRGGVLNAGSSLFNWLTGK